jgi:hypothetical protein
MKNKIQTVYKISNNQLFKNQNQTGVIVIYNYFYKKEISLNLYIEDNHIFIIKPLLSFMKWPRISSPVNLIIDPEGNIWKEKDKCIFDEIL